MFDPENILTDQCENALESVSFNKLRNKRAIQKVNYSAIDSFTIYY